MSKMDKDYTIFLVFCYNILILLSFIFLCVRPLGFSADDLNYERIFSDSIYNKGFINQEVEPLYLIVSRIILSFDGGFFWILLIFGGLGFLIKVNFINKFYSNIYAKIFFLLSYLFCIYPLHDLTQLRVSLAIALFLLSIRFRDIFILGYLVMILSILSHYSVVPAIVMYLYQTKFMKFISFKYRPYFLFLLYGSVAIFVYFLTQNTEMRYGEGNYPSYYYFIHPFFISIVLVLFFKRVYLKQDNFYLNIIYKISLMYTLFFVVFLFANSQIAAFRFLEMAYVFIIFIVCFSVKNVKDLISWGLITFTMPLFGMLISSQSSFNWEILMNWIHNGFGVF